VESVERRDDHLDQEGTGDDGREGDDGFGVHDLERETQPAVSFPSFSLRLIREQLNKMYGTDECDTYVELLRDGDSSDSGSSEDGSGLCSEGSLGDGGEEGSSLLFGRGSVKSGSRGV